MTSQPGYTYIDHGSAVMGNAWIERTWSAFLGNTISLTHKESGEEWVARQSGEIAFEANDEAFNFMGLGGAEWSEEANPLAAGLMAVFESPGGIVVTLKSHALNESPGLSRAMSIHNLSGAPLRVKNVAMEDLILREARVRVDQFTREATSVSWITNEPAAALLAPKGGLLLGMDGGGRYDLFTPDAGRCTLCCAEERTLQHGETWHLPETFLLAFTGPVESCLTRGYSQFLNDVRRLRTWEKKRESELRAIGETEAE